MILIGHHWVGSTLDFLLCLTLVHYHWALKFFYWDVEFGGQYICSKLHHIVDTLSRVYIYIMSALYKQLIKITIIGEADWSCAECAGWWSFIWQDGKVVIQAPQAPKAPCKTTTKKTKQSQIEIFLATVLWMLEGLAHSTVVHHSTDIELSVLARRL